METAPAAFTAILLASSRSNNFAADRRPGSSSKIAISELLAVGVAHDEASRLFLDGPRRREAAFRQRGYWCRFLRSSSSSFFASVSN
jgi:hypothetical protein